jgi:hypothetical protein
MISLSTFIKSNFTVYNYCLKYVIFVDYSVIIKLFDFFHIYGSCNRLKSYDWSKCHHSHRLKTSQVERMQRPQTGYR